MNEAHKQYNLLDTIFNYIFNLWQSLVDQGVDIQYVRLLAALYESQCGHVCGGAQSKAFKIERGTKQGDPLSPMLFNAALEKVMGQLQTSWQTQGWGALVHNEGDRRLTNLRFADDIMLIATSKRQLQRMLGELVVKVTEAGLKIHPGKTEIMSNDTENRGGSLKFDGGLVDILPFSGSTAYLGRDLCFEGSHDVEITSRINKAWKKFFALKPDLCGKHVSLRCRLKLFNATVTPTLLYGSGSWTMTADRERTLRTTQRRMLRWMLGSFWKRPDKEESQEEAGDSDSDCPEPVEEDASENCEDEQETWVQWIRRCTRIAEDQLGRASIDDWVVAQRRRKWRLAGHTARRDDNRWSETLLGWQPPYSNRGRGHPCKRWTTDLDAYLYHVDGVPRWVWKAVALDRGRWQALEEGFISQAWYR